MAKLVCRELDFRPKDAEDVSALYFAVEDEKHDHAFQAPAIVLLEHGFARCFACEGSINCEHATMVLKMVDQW